MTCPGVTKGRTDVGLMALQGEMKKVYKNAFASRELAYEKLADRRGAVIISKNSPLQNLSGDTISREELSRYPLAYYENGFLDSTVDTMLGMPEGGIKRKSAGSTTLPESSLPRPKNISQHLKQTSRGNQQTCFHFP